MGRKIPQAKRSEWVDALSCKIYNALYIKNMNPADLISLNNMHQVKNSKEFKQIHKEVQIIESDKYQKEYTSKGLNVYQNTIVNEIVERIRSCTFPNCQYLCQSWHQEMDQSNIKADNIKSVYTQLLELQHGLAELPKEDITHKQDEHTENNQKNESEEENKSIDEIKTSTGSGNNNSRMTMKCPKCKTNKFIQYDTKTTRGDESFKLNLSCSKCKTNWVM